MSFKISFGSLTNRTLDAIGLPDSIGDAVGAIVDLGSGNVSGAMQNAIDLIADFGKVTPQSITAAGRRPDFSAAFLPRPEPLAEQAQIGSRYAYQRGGKWVTGRVTGKKYHGSFAKPVRLRGHHYMFRGRMYSSLDKLIRDASDGRMDGLDYNKASLYNAQLFQSLAEIFGKSKASGPASGTDGAASSNVSSTSGSSADGASSNSASGNWDFLRNPSLSLEEKLMLLMAKLAEHYDDEINEKMGEIEKASGKGSGSKEQSSDLQTLQVNLQMLMQQRQQMFQTVTAMLRSLHDTSMAAIRNLKA